MTNKIKLTIVVIYSISIFACKENPSAIKDSLVNPDVVYVGRKLVKTGWGVATSIILTDINGNNHKELISVSDGGVSDPNFSPKGDKIVFTMKSESRGKSDNLYYFNIDGSGLHKLTDDDTTLIYSNPQYISNETILFMCRVNGQDHQIRVLNIVTKAQTVLVQNTPSLAPPVISSDGLLIYYIHPDGNVHKVSINGVDNKLTNLSYSSQIQMTATKSKLYFVSIPSQGLFDLYSMDLDGTNISRLTNNNDITISGAYLRISPDGNKIINQLPGQNGGCDTWVMNSDGSNKTLAINFLRWGGEPVFFTNSKKIVIQNQSNTTNDFNQQLYSVDLDGNSLKIISMMEYYDNYSPKFHP